MSPKGVVSNFLETLFTARNARNSLALALSDDQTMELRSVGKVAGGIDWSSSIKPNEAFDFIMIDMPLGMGRRNVEIGNSTLNVRGNWVQLLGSCAHVFANYPGQPGSVLS